MASLLLRRSRTLVPNHQHLQSKLASLLLGSGSAFINHHSSSHTFRSSSQPFVASSRYESTKAQAQLDLQHVTHDDHDDQVHALKIFIRRLSIFFSL